MRIGGKPFKLYREQLDIVAPYFDGVRETVVVLPKKNGKSTLVAAVAIYHLLTTLDAECIIVAASRDQAEVILDQARKFIQNTSALRAHMRVMRREIQLLKGDGRVRVLASDEDTADGVLPTLAIVDELHRARTGGLYTILRLAIGTTGGRMITISTAGASMDTPLGEKRRKAQEMPGFVRDERRRRSFVRSADGAFAFIEWSLNLEDDPNDLKLVKLVNPAPWKTPAMLAEEKASVTLWEWLRFACGIWTEGEEPALDPGTWDELGDSSLEITGGSEVWCGVDRGAVGEPTAIAIIRTDGTEIWAKVQMIEPIGAAPVPLADVEQAVRDLHALYLIRGVVYDTRSFERSADLLEEEGVPMVEFPQSVEGLTAASGTFHKLVEEGKLHHDADPALRAHVLGARIKQDERGWRFRKDPRTQRPTDGLFALAVAAHVALTVPPDAVPAFFSLGG